MLRMHARRRLRRGAAALASLIAIACGESPAPPVAAPSAPATDVAGPGDDLPWFEGSVEEAFALAARERRPIFLYWGAVWCPPCHALRSRLFTRPEFRVRLAESVAVYLDGDTERAQIWGEKLGTAGYPTVIVFDADGREVTRIATMLPIEQYAEVLARALDATRPLHEVLVAAEREGPAALPAAELNLLAFYSFDQDARLDLDESRRLALFERLWRETPAGQPIERQRFLGLLLQTLARVDPAPELAAGARAELATALAGLLADPRARATNLDLLLYAAPGVVRRLAPEPGAERDALVAAWNAAARAVEDDPELALDDRLTALLPQLELALLDAAGDSPAPPAALRERIRQRVAWASGEVRDADELQAVMSTMAGLLEDAGLAGEAERLLADKLGETAAPYYYLSWLASLEARAGRTAAAVDRYREAWQGARASGSGAAMTPFRWGSTYLRRALELAPADSATIRADGDTILADLLASPDAFAGGNWSRLEGLGLALTAWRGDDAERGAVVAALRARVAEGCPRFPDEGPDSPASRCRSFLAPAPAG